tara:strand:+ start:1665 stop:2381 length:717 start_codon:yes stop_codon:yes gene_type:complete
MAEIKIYPTKQLVAENFSVFFKKLITNKEAFHVALSGGSTPKIVFDHLATHFADDIDWSKILLYWGDERCVPPTDSESNYKMTLQHLLSKISIPEENIFRILGENNPKQEAKRYSTILDENLPTKYDIPKFDLVILGMGDDGHTASIFPHEIDIWHSKANCEVAIHPDSAQNRITITGKIINNAEVVAFLVTGPTKAEKVKEIIKEIVGYKNYPATLVNPTSGELIWFLDSEAAKEIC